MHILFLTDNFPPEINAPASRTFEHCREWVKSGHQVTVITCAPNFPKGKVYAGYKNKIWQSETIEGVRVIRVWTYIKANEGFVRRILDYLSYMVSACIASFFVRKIDIVVGTSPQFFTVAAAYFVGLVRRRPYVFELRDMWPESIKAVGAMKDSKIIRLFESLEMFLYRKAARIVSVTHSFKKVLIDRGIDGDKINIITNGVDIIRFSPQAKSVDLTNQYELDDKFVVGYIGTHGLAHELETILKAAKLLKDANDNSVHFILLGHGATKNELVKLAKEMMLDNVTFIDSVSKDEVVQYWSLLDVSIIHLKRTPLFTSVIPSKLFECMSMGLPVLHGVEGESADIVRDEGVGVTFIPENEVDLVKNLLVLQHDANLYSQLKANCLVAAHKYNRIKLAEDMLDILEELCIKKKINSNKSRQWLGL